MNGRTLILSFCLLLFSAELFAQQIAFPTGDGKLRLFNYHLDEFLEVEFRKEGKLIPEAVQKIGQLLRSRDNAEARTIDARLLDLIDHLQDRFQADTIEIISGYRRKEFNETLLKGGHKVSPVSLHTKGQALDIHIDEIREETLRDYLLTLRLGGVGYYGPLDFVHVDVGPFRQWQEAGRARKLVGVLQPDASLQLTSDRNDYLPHETLVFEWKGGQDSDLAKIKQIQLEHFSRGKWEKIGEYPRTPNRWTLTARSAIFGDGQGGIRFGKYRWIFSLPAGNSPQSSNEFYLKRS